MDSKWSCMEHPTLKVQDSKVTIITRDFSMIRQHTLWRKKNISNKTVRFMLRSTNYYLQITLLIILLYWNKECTIINSQFIFIKVIFLINNEYGCIIKYRTQVLISLSFKIKLDTPIVPVSTCKNVIHAYHI